MYKSKDSKKNELMIIPSPYNNILTGIPYFPVLRICDILVRILIRLSYPDLWLTDPDPTPFFIDFNKGCKKNNFFFFL